jgi:hypothetical protein
MSTPRYRTLDGDELEFPLAMGRWVLVPRSLARFDPELAWALDYEDAPEPDDADPRLDFALGALLVPVERWNDHAELEPNLAPCRPPSPAAPSEPPLSAAGVLTSAREDVPMSRAFAAGLASAAERAASAAIATLALAYAVGVAVWLWSLRGGITGARVSVGLVLVGAAVLVAWFAGVAGVEAGPSPRSSVRERSGARASGCILRLAEDPLDTLRLGLVVQVVGFSLLVALR